MRYLVILLLALTTGCGMQVQNEEWGVPTTLWKTVTPEEKAAWAEAERRKAAEEQQSRWNALIGSYAPFCERLGFAADTDPWRNCILQRLMADEQRRNIATDRAAYDVSRTLVRQPINCQFIGRYMTCY